MLEPHPALPVSAEVVSPAIDQVSRRRMLAAAALAVSTMTDAASSRAPFPAAQRAAKPVDVALQGMACGGRRVAVPQVLNQPVVEATKIASAVVNLL